MTSEQGGEGQPGDGRGGRAKPVGRPCKARGAGVTQASLHLAHKTSEPGGRSWQRKTKEEFCFDRAVALGAHPGADWGKRSSRKTCWKRVGGERAKS